MTKKTKPEMKRAPKEHRTTTDKTRGETNNRVKERERAGCDRNSVAYNRRRFDKIETDIKEIKPKLDQVYKDMAEVLDIADKIAAMRERIDDMFEFYTNNRASEPLKDAL